MVREIEEETSIITRNPKTIFKFIDYIKKYSEIYFLCEYVHGGEPRVIGEEFARMKYQNIYEPMWVGLNKFKKLNVLPKFAKDWVIENNYSIDYRNV